MISEKPIDFDRFIRWAITAAIICGLYFLIDRLSAVLLPFLLAWLTAYLLDPLVNLYQRLLKKRILAVAALFISLLAIATVAVVLLLPLMAEEFQSLFRLIDGQVEQMHWPAWIPKDLVLKAQAWLQNFDYASVLQNEGMMDKLGAALSGVWNTVTGVYGIIGALFGFVSYAIYLIFLMLDFQSLAGKWKTYIPKKYRSFTSELAEDLEEQMNGYFRAQTKIVITVAILFAIGFKLIGLPFAIVLGILVGVLNYIPYMQLVGLLPAVALAALKSLESGQAMWIPILLVLVVFAIIQLIQEVVLNPRFLGGFSGLHPAIILLSLSIWGALLGMVGLIIAIPVTAIILSYYRRYVVTE